MFLRLGSVKEHSARSTLHLIPCRTPHQFIFIKNSIAILPPLSAQSSFCLTHLSVILTHMNFSSQSISHAIPYLQVPLKLHKCRSSTTPVIHSFPFNHSSNLSFKTEAHLLKKFNPELAISFTSNSNTPTNSQSFCFLWDLWITHRICCCSNI